MTSRSEALRQDAFLGGRVQAWQPAQGYRAGIDAVLLAAACPAVPGERVLELGCGVGVASLCLNARVPSLQIVGLERQAEMAALARRNGLSVVEGDLGQMPDALKDQNFDHVIMNPPYYDRSRTASGPNDQREAAMGEDTPMATWLQVARRRLRPKGWLTLIQQTERLPDILEGLGGFGSITVLPLLPREGRPAKRILIRTRKMGGGVLELRAPVTLHAGASHMADSEDYTPEISSVLRDGAVMPGF